VRLVMIATSAQFHPSPRGRWLPLARQLGRAGVDVHWMGLHPHFSPDMRHPHDDNGVAVQHVAPMHVDAHGPLRGWRLYAQVLGASWQLARHAIQLRPDVVCICKAQPTNSLAALLIHAVTGARLVLDSDDDEAGSHDVTQRWQYQLMAWCEQFITGRVSSVSTASSLLAQRAQQWGALRVAHVATGITIPSHYPVIPYALPTPYLVYVGNVATHAHGFDLLLHALAHDARIPPLVIAGSGHAAEAMRTLAAQLGVAHRCLWLGTIPAAHVPTLLRGAVASIDPVRQGHAAAARFPLKILESLAVGTPVITSPDGDRAALVGAAGILVPAGDVAALAHACATIMTHHFVRSRVQQQVAALEWTSLAHMWGRVHQLI
jgi:glycosyltransferase involved in cell wall biosynthesis